MGMWENFKKMVSVSDEDEYDDTEYTEEEVAPKGRKDSYYDSDDTYTSTKKAEPPVRGVRDDKRGKVVSFNQNSSMQVVLVKPERFEDVPAIADHLNEKKTVLLNLESANRETSRRLIDFLSGVAYANKGSIRKVANSTFIIAPTDVDVMGELMIDDLEEGKLYL